MESNRMSPSEKADLELRIDYLTKLLDNPGWKLFAEYASWTASSETAKACAQHEPVPLALHVGASKALMDMATWPIREVNQARDRLRLDNEALNSPQ